MALGDGIRRDIATISDEERTLFVNAIRALDNSASAFVYGNNAGNEAADGSGNITYWDMQEQIHKDAHAHGIDVHAGPAFVPWHRDLVNRMEQLIRLVDPRLSLHYWDWTTDPRVATADRVAILTGTAPGSPVGFMGASQGNASAPFADFESTEISGDPLEGIPGDGVHDRIWRGVGAGPSPVPSDNSILGNLDFTSFNAALQSAHNTAHGYIGGTIGGGPFAAHFSFHDPMVFLLHSNMDRLWATWQRQPNAQSRLDPAHAYGNILADEGLPPNYFDEWIQPWAGVDSGGTLQTNLNPWKDNINNQRAPTPYNDPSIIIPASYDTAVHASYIIVNRDTFSTSEINTGKLTYQNVFHVVYDGFTPEELLATPPAIPANLPSLTFTGASKITAAISTMNPVSYENPGGAVDMPQRIMLSFDLKFTDGSDFPTTSGGKNFVTMQASLSYNVDTGTGGTIVPQTAVASTELVLVNQPNPYMIDVDPAAQNPYWLSIDTRVFQVKGPGGGNLADSKLGVTQGDMDTDSNAPFTFINGVLSALRTSPSQFDNTTIFPTDETASQLELSQKAGPGNTQRVYNYALARVRYLAPSGVAGVPATGVGVFFRVFSTAVSGLDYDATSETGNGNYRRHVISNATATNPATAVPLLGIETDSQGNPETASIPFFASPRVNPSTTSMRSQLIDTPNFQTINNTGSENVQFFGAWLDINLAPGDPHFVQLPLNSTGVTNWPDGPYSGSASNSIQQLMLGTHHCLVAEIFFWPPATAGDPISQDASPASSDRLAQRNLVLVKSGNPGFPATHQVQTTFIAKPSTTIMIDQPRTVAAGRDPAASRQTQDGFVIRPDELIIRWNNVPRDSEATIYTPEIGSDEILALSALRQHPTVLEKIDAHTVRCRLADVTFIPLPMNRQGTIAGLMSLTLPQGVRAGDVYRFSVEQYSGVTLKTLGAFQMTIPVRPDAEILPEETKKLSVMRYIQQAIPTSNRWYSVFARYTDQIATRLLGLGGDPNAILPSPVPHPFGVWETTNCLNPVAVVNFLNGQPAPVAAFATEMPGGSINVYYRAQPGQAGVWETTNCLNPAAVVNFLNGQPAPVAAFATEMSGGSINVYYRAQPRPVGVWQTTNCPNPVEVVNFLNGQPGPVAAFATEMPGGSINLYYLS
jgi:hypothetical protein